MARPPAYVHDRNLCCTGTGSTAMMVATIVASSYAITIPDVCIHEGPPVLWLVAGQSYLHTSV